MWESVEKIITEKNITQYELSKKMKVSVSVITELKKGRIKKPSFELACKIADALEISLDQLRKEQPK
ncbi:hypothetical protein IGJ55_002121 [Enterococcus sp. AZ170]|uniref:helix-turn-helix domain-containing protein n=1 Tax=Enterococcus sp. AZ170 TaxID=2774747 RepID=UPI003D300EA9